MDMDYDYYEHKIRRSEGIYKICVVCATVILTLIVFLMLTGCRSLKTGVSEKTDTSDSVRIEYIERVVKVPVTVYVEVPVESKERLSPDSTSHLETSFAVSDASMIWIGGVAFLRHSLTNKSRRIAKTDSVPVTEKERTLWRTRRVTYTKTEIREKQLSRWDQLKVDYGGIVILILLFIFMICLCIKAFIGFRRKSV